MRLHYIEICLLEKLLLALRCNPRVLDLEVVDFFCEYNITDVYRLMLSL